MICYVPLGAWQHAHLECVHHVAASIIYCHVVVLLRRVCCRALRGMHRIIIIYIERGN